MNSLRRLWLFASIALMIPVGARPLPAQAAPSQLVTREIHSTALAHSKIGTDPVRRLTIYLPAGYDGSQKRYPVLYYLDNSSRAIFDQQHAQQIFDRSIASGIVQPFVLVCVDGSTPMGSSWYVNSSATGNWDDYIVQELVPYETPTFALCPHATRAVLPATSWGPTEHCAWAWCMPRSSELSTRCIPSEQAPGYASWTRFPTST